MSPNVGNSIPNEQETTDPDADERRLPTAGDTHLPPDQRHSLVLFQLLPKRLKYNFASKQGLKKLGSRLEEK